MMQIVTANIHMGTDRLWTDLNVQIDVNNWYQKLKPWLFDLQVCQLQFSSTTVGERAWGPKIYKFPFSFHQGASASRTPSSDRSK